MSVPYAEARIKVERLVERFARNLDAYKQTDYKEARVRGEHEDMPDNQDRVTAGVGSALGGFTKAAGRQC